MADPTPAGEQPRIVQVVLLGHQHPPGVLLVAGLLVGRGQLPVRLRGVRLHPPQPGEPLGDRDGQVAGAGHPPVGQPVQQQPDVCR